MFVLMVVLALLAPYHPGETRTLSLFVDSAQESVEVQVNGAELIQVEGALCDITWSSRAACPKADRLDLTMRVPELARRGDVVEVLIYVDGEIRSVQRVPVIAPYRVYAPVVTG